MNKILLVEDDITLRECIRDVLLENNYLVETASDGAIALDMIKKSPPDLVILDLGLPKVTGESVCIEIKKLHPDIPVIILTAKNQTSDVVRGFNLGADDYMSKPFELDELIARIKVQLKSTDQEVLQIADLIVHTKSLEVFRNGKQITLSPHEYKLLQYLMMNKGTVLSREMILNRIWQYSYDVDSRVVDVYIGYLRKKIDADSKRKLITSVRGFGYVIKE
jgi:DNA-binding response OmpR family regulator